jgi:hypothetical protein
MLGAFVLSTMEAEFDRKLSLGLLNLLYKRDIIIL